MKKFFTLKNCLIILFCFSIFAYLIAIIVHTTKIVNWYNQYINHLNEVISSGDPNYIIGQELLESYKNTRNGYLISLIFNYFILSFNIVFFILFISQVLYKMNCLKFAFISLAYTCFATYMLQTSIQFFINFSDASDGVSGLAIAITTLIVTLISIPCYVYLLLKEIKRRKSVTENEPVIDTLESMQDNITEQE